MLIVQYGNRRRLVKATPLIHLLIVTFSGHPNVKAFITHGGLLGTTEGVHCGVPAIVMPQFGDQYTNAKALEASGGGVILDFGRITDETVDDALKTVLDPRYVCVYVVSSPAQN